MSSQAGTMTRRSTSGLVLAFLSGLTLSVSSLMTKLAKESTFLQITFLRTLLIGCSLVLWWILNGHWTKTRKLVFNLPITTVAWLFVRTFSSFVAMTTAYAVYQQIPMGDATAVFGATPIFTGLVGVVLLGEPWQHKHITLTILAWTGISLIYKPRFLTNLMWNSEEGHSEAGYQSPDKFYLGLAVLVPIGSSLSFVLSRKLSRSISPSIIICLTSIGIAIYSAVALATTETLRLPPVTDWKYLLPEVIAGLTSQSLMGKALQRERAAPVTLMRNSSIIASFILQFVLFGVVPGWGSIVGAALIVLATALLAV